MLAHFISLTILILLGFFISLVINLIQPLSMVAQTPTAQILVQNTTNAATQEQQGRNFYQEGNFSEAVRLWQQAAQIYKNQGNKVNQASVLSNLALAYQQLGQWQQAKQAMRESLALMQQEQPSPTYLQVYAQILNNQGLLQFSQGNAQFAYDSWREAAQVYATVEDSAGVFRAQINQAMALQFLGLYPRTCKILIEALNLSPFSCEKARVQTNEQRQQNQAILLEKLNIVASSLDTIHFLAWRRLANVLRANGILPESELILKTLEPLTFGEDRATLLLSLGKIAQIQNNPSQALNLYQQATTIAKTPSTQVQSQLAEFRLLILTRQWSMAAELVPDLLENLSYLPPNHTNFYAKINFIHNLTLLKQANQEQNLGLNLPAYEQIAQISSEVVQKAKELADKYSESYGLGILGAIYEQMQQWSMAQHFTEQALLIAQSINTPEISYRWQWQLGRILRAKNNLNDSITAYSEAIESLKSIKNDLAAMGRDIQFSFQAEVEPVYRELIALLLSPDDLGHISQENLIKARQVIEDLQVAELDNFFQEACLVTEPQSLENIDQEAAVIYPIILPDRLAILLSLPQQPIRYYSSFVNSQKLEKVVKDFRYNLVVRSKRDFLANGQQLYQWLIEPIEQELQQAKTKTLVFVADQFLRNIPLNALYDGKKYLIEKNYNVSVTSGLQIIAPKSLKETNLLILGAGISEAQVIQGKNFPPLPYVKEELEEIKTTVPSQIILNQGFTSKALNDNLRKDYFPLIHLATHGQFSSNFEQTYIVTWEDKINILKLEKLLKQRSQQQVALELLVLSACETASGDNRAALGLAGMAVRSGARSTLATLWSVNDEASAEFMSQFYRILATRTVTKTEAVRQAQLKLLANPRYNHPFYWAAYTLVGNWL
jgi:CHAT domain-containing protein